VTQLVTNRHTIFLGNVEERLKDLPDRSVHCIVTSPPYFGLRDYLTAKYEGGDPECDHRPTRAKGDTTSGLEGSTDSQNHRQSGFKGDTCPKCGATKTDNQLGLEKTPEAYIKRLVDIMREARRVLRDDGSLWLNLGDSYWGSWGNSGNRPQLDGESRGQRKRETDYMPRPGYDEHRDRPAASYKVDGLKAKDLIGIPWLAAFALRADGWWLRSDCIWAKPNPMPESVTDRPAKAHEYLFLLTKSADYYYDHEAVKEKDSGLASGNGFVGRQGGAEHQAKSGGEGTKEKWQPGKGRNKRTVWNVSTLPSQVSHFAVFPPAIPLTCISASTSSHGVCAVCGAPWRRIMEDTGIEDPSYRGSKFDQGKTAVHQLGKAGTPTRTIKRGVGWDPTCSCVNSHPVPATVLDVFHGSGTTGAVAEYLGRRYVGIELNPDYVELYDARCAEVRRAIIGGDSPDREGPADGQMGLFGDQP
jgi:DNA modification methylase